jgi:molybdopterin-guanine dinucleotide biosynthesis protein A
MLGIVLAGGRSSRFGADKALAQLGGHSMLSHIVACAAPQVDELLVSRNERAGVDADCILLRDQYPGEGPLAGLLAALAYADTHRFSHVASFPCDTPFFPEDIVTRLAGGLTSPSPGFCVARRNGSEQHAFAVWTADCLRPLEAAFAGGLRSLKGCAAILAKADVDFHESGNGPGNDPFFNINSPEDLVIAEQWLASAGRV